MLYKYNWLLFFMLILVVAACTPAGAEPDAAPQDEGVEQESAAAVAAARQALADAMGLAPGALVPALIESAEWRDSCLGLGGPAESCAAVLTPGYAVTFNVAGENVTVRTDLDGNQARVEVAGAQEPGGDDLPPAVTAARAGLAQALGVAVDDIALLGFEQREWSDSCLGLGGPAEICAAVVTPGWEVALEMAGQPYNVRTDVNGEQVRVADESAGAPAGEIPGPELNGALIFFQRSGGLDGLLLTVRIYPDGRIAYAQGEPSPDLPVETITVEPAAVEMLIEELRAAGYFGLERTYLPQDTCCDRFLYLISVQDETSPHAVEALDGTEGTPEALWQSIGAIEALIDAALGS